MKFILLKDVSFVKPLFLYTFLFITLVYFIKFLITKLVITNLSLIKKKCFLTISLTILSYELLIVFAVAELIEIHQGSLIIPLLINLLLNSK